MNFQTTCMTIILNRSSSAASMRAVPQALPPSPKFVIGRGSVVESIVQVTTTSSEPYIAILGSGGIGKTTIATTVLHDSRITSVYPRRYFVSSELAPTIELLEIRVADALSIPQSERGADLVSRIVDHICRDGHPVLLYIDNLESIWEIKSEQPKVDYFLDVLSGATNRLAILVTMRGTQELKTSFPWHSTILSGLEMQDSVTMYEKLSTKSADASAQELLSKLSGSPLAVKLFALMVKEGDKPAQLLSSWNEHGAGALEIGGKHRLSSLEQSIHLSVFSPRIDDNARLVLGFMALLPDGLSTSFPWFEGFESILPGKITLQPALRGLRRAALLDENGEPSRWQMLPPIRQFCLQLVDSASSAVASLVQLYIKTITQHGDYSSSTSQATILPEMANIRGLLLHGFKLQPLPLYIGAASAKYAGWADWQAIDESVFLSSILHLPVPDGDLAHIHRRLGKLNSTWDRLDAAEASLTKALELYRHVQDRLGAANAHKSIGSLQLRRYQLEEAGVSFKCALELYKDAENRTGEANAHTAIGDLHMRRDQLDAAEVSLICALGLYKDAKNRLGEANAHIAIGDLQMRRDQLDAAEVSFRGALELYKDVKDRTGEASAHKSIGGLQLRRDQLDAAEVSLKRALELFQDVKHRGGEADARIATGDLYMRRHQLEAAELSFRCALQLYKDTKTRRGEANACIAIGDLHMRRDQLEAAGVSFRCALGIYKYIKNRTGEASANIFIGDLRIRQGQLDAAEVSFRCAIELYKDVEDRLGEAIVHTSIGDLHMCQDQLDAAEVSFRCALELYKDVKDQVGEANAHISIGKLHTRRDQLEAARVSFRCALVQHSEIQDQWGIAACTFLLGQVSFRNREFDAADSAFSEALALWEVIGDARNIAETHQAIGDLHLQRIQLDDAETSLHRALDIYTTEITALVFEALTNRSIGKLHLLRDQYEESERAFQRALELDAAASSRVGQGQTYRCLGEMFVKRGDLGAAESSYNDALRLFFEIEDYQATPCLLDLGKVWVQQGKIEESEATDAVALKTRWDVKKTA
ncbi:hypothetical protein DL96DRAFT_600741 [Flagelloscypha sp. PMI_526]|nr:hypothetical protein DL96DRAFT_600741 [Flagelloscypha sp. PMI_526]